MPYGKQKAAVRQYFQSHFEFINTHVPAVVQRIREKNGDTCTLPKTTISAEHIERFLSAIDAAIDQMLPHQPQLTLEVDYQPIFTLESIIRNTFGDETEAFCRQAKFPFKLQIRIYQDKVSIFNNEMKVL